MRYSRALHRRLTKLEAVTNLLSTEEKWNSVHARALAFMSDDDLRIMEEIAVLRAADREIDETPEREAVTARYDEATFRALGEQNVRFTIAEIDHLLA
jgi:hypothetical protein